MMNHIFQTSVLLIVIIECIELNWFCKDADKIRSSQPAIPGTELNKTQLFPVIIVKLSLLRNIFCVISVDEKI